MARPLTKKKKNGGRYTRHQEIENEIDSVLALSLDEQRKHLLISMPKQKGYLRSETLVHMARIAVRHNDQSFREAVVKVLFIRCEANLKSTVANRLPNADDIRLEVLSQFGGLIAKDGTGKNPNQLDAFECRFNLVFKALRIDVVRRELKLTNRIASLPNAQSTDEADDVEDAFERLVSRKRSPDTTAEYSPSPEELLIVKDILAAIEALPPDEQMALKLVRILGYTELAAAEKLGVSDRTIRNYITSATARLKGMKEFV